MYNLVSTVVSEKKKMCKNILFQMHVVLCQTISSYGIRIGGVMARLLAYNVVDHGLEPGRINPKTIGLVFTASPLSTQY